MDNELQWIPYIALLGRCIVRDSDDLRVLHLAPTPEALSAWTTFHREMAHTRDDEAIIVYSDYVCPFCYLGRESLRQYQAMREENLRIEWRPFDLRASKRGDDGTIDHSVGDGKGEAYYEQARENVQRLQDRYDIDMAQDIAREVDSLLAQLASTFVRDEYPDRWLAFDEAVFDALWKEGRDIGDVDVVTDLAEQVGLDPGNIRVAVADSDRRQRLHEEFDAAHRQGITAVPTFVYGEHVARGAVPPDHLQRLVEGG